MSNMRTHFSHRAFLISQLLLTISCAVPLSAQTSRAYATIRIDARKVENRISPLLYGQFLEYMFEGIKFGLHAELLRDRSFENAPNATLVA